MPIALDHVKYVTTRSFAEGAYRRLEGLERVAVFIRQVPLEAGTKLPIGRKKYKVEHKSYLVFIDLKHDANFAHPVLYELHNVDDGSVTVIEEQFPIADPEIERSLVPHILPDKEGGK